MKRVSVALQCLLCGARLADPQPAWQAVPTALALQGCFCLHEERTVALDNTISYQGHRLQLLPTIERLSFARAKVGGACAL